MKGCHVLLRTVSRVVLVLVAGILLLAGCGEATTPPLGSVAGVATHMAQDIPTEIPVTPTLVPVSGTGAPPLVFFGDSLTRGFYASSSDQRFASLVGADMHLPSMILGQYGATAVVSADRMRQAPPGQAVPSDAGYIIIELGTNDVVANESLSQFQDAYDYILTRVHQDAPGAQVICLGTWRNPNAGTHESGYAHNQIIQRDCAKIAGGTYRGLGDLFMVDAYHGPAGRPTFLGAGDSFHPNNAGHWAIASRVESAMS